ncbi:hypothetical protein SLE2022_202910 [Rubroshorea leprosula]
MSRVYVGNLDPKVSERDLEDEFLAFGVLCSVWVARRPAGYAFVEFDYRRDAIDASCELDGVLLVHWFRRSTSKPSPHCHMSPSYGHGRKTYSPHGRKSPRRRSFSPGCGCSHSRSPPYHCSRHNSPYANW